MFNNIIIIKINLRFNYIIKSFINNINFRIITLGLIIFIILFYINIIMTEI